MTSDPDIGSTFITQFKVLEVLMFQSFYILWVLLRKQSSFLNDF